MRVLFAAGLFVLGCSEVAGLQAPAIDERTQSILEIHVPEPGALPRVFAHDRASFSGGRLGPFISVAGGRPPDYWLEYFDESLGELGLVAGPLTPVAPTDCGARPLPRGREIFQLSSGAEGFEFVSAGSVQVAPELYVAGPCVCDPAPEFRLIQLDGVCRPHASFSGEGQLLVAVRLDEDCQDGKLPEGRLLRVDLRRGEVVESSTSAVSPTEIFTTDEQTFYFGESRGRLFRQREDEAPERVFEAPPPAQDLRRIRGGLAADGTLELVLAIDPPDLPEPGELRPGVALYRYRVQDGRGELLYPPAPSGPNTRQRLVLLWLDSTRMILFPENTSAWVDIREGQATRAPWPFIGSIRAGVVRPNGDAIVGTYLGQFYELPAGHEAWQEASGFEPAAGTDVLALAALDQGEEWYYLRPDAIGRRISGTSCPPLPSPFLLHDVVAMLARGTEVAIIAERVDRSGSTIIYRPPAN